MNLPPEKEGSRLSSLSLQPDSQDYRTLFLTFKKCKKESARGGGGNSTPSLHARHQFIHLPLWIGLWGSLSSSYLRGGILQDLLCLAPPLPHCRAVQRFCGRGLRRRLGMDTFWVFTFHLYVVNLTENYGG